MSRKIALHTALGLTGLIAAATPSFASAQAQGAPAAAARAANALDEVVVTARRREERLQDVPLAVSALSPATLERQNITDLGSLNGRVPSLMIAPSLGGGAALTFAIRGQSQQELTGFADPSVSLYVNDIPVPRALGAKVGFFDMAAVEVAKGPQGTLFGRNTTGGAVLVRTQQPVDTFEAYVSGMLGNFAQRTVDGMVNVPVNDAVSVRVAAQHVERKGYLTDVITNKDINHVNENAVRGAISFHPNDRLKSNFNAAYSEAHDGGIGGFVSFSLNPLFAPYLAPQQARGIYKTASGLPMFERIKNYSFDNTTSYVLNEHFTIKNIVGYRHVQLHSLEDLDGTPALLFPVERLVKQHQITEEFQIQATYQKLDFIVGAFYFREKENDQALSTGGLVGTGAVDPGDIEPSTILAFAPRYSNTWVAPTNTSYAVFAQGTYKLTSKLGLTLGVRANRDTRQAVVFNRAFQPAISTADLTCRFTLDEDHNPATPETRPTLANCAFRDKTTFSEPTYNLSLDYHVDENTLIYAAHRHGYRTGGYGARGNSQVTLSDTFDPETVNDFELGLKSDLRFDNGMFLRTNLAVYSATYHGAQRILNKGLAPPITVTLNAGKATINGSELEMLFRPSQMFELSGFWAYTDAKFKNYVDPNGNDLSPQVYPHTPKNVFSVTAQVILPTDDHVGGMRFGLTYMHQGKYDWNDNYELEKTSAGVALPNGVLYNAAQIIPAYGLWNAKFEWTDVMGSNVDLSAFVDNLTNKQYIVPYMSVSAAFETRGPGAPRMFGVRAKARFN